MFALFYTMFNVTLYQELIKLFIIIIIIMPKQVLINITIINYIAHII